MNKKATFFLLSLFTSLSLNDAVSNTYKVQKGDTLYSLSKQYGTSIDLLSKMNDLPAPFNLQIGQELSVPKGLSGIASNLLNKKTDNDSSNADKKPAKPEVAIIKNPFNPISNQIDLDKNTAQHHTVEKGDTLFSISRKYNVTARDLILNNDIQPPYNLAIGQVVNLPKEGQKQITNQFIINKNVSSISNEKNALNKDLNFIWPIKGLVSLQFDGAGKDSSNKGINISGNQGDDIKASESGRISYIGNEVKGLGNIIVIKHVQGYKTVYAHLNSIIVQRGDYVNKGEKIGTVGSSGKVQEPQLHFEIRKNSKVLNPSQIIKD